MTTSTQAAPTLLQQLKLSGVYVTEVPLCGRFHWSKHQEDVEQLSRFCDLNSTFQFPDASRMVLASRVNTGGQYITTGKLYQIALKAILLEQSQWYKTFSVTQSSRNASVICFGPERCVPPTIMRKLDSRLTIVSDIDLSTSPLPCQLFNGNRTNRLADLPDERIAVIGMACQIPGAEDLEDFQKILSSGKSQHKEIPADRFGMGMNWRNLDPKRKWYGNFIQDYDTFDHKFFKKAPREMASTDPQHRLILQIAYQAVEQSGYFRAPDFDKHIGCFMGVGNVDYEDNIACYPANAYSATGNLKSFLAGKISHYFGWTGSSLTLDTACSSSSVAIHQACRSILNGECTAALAGGVNIITSPEWYHNLAGASFLSPTGQCKPFDAKGDGYCRGEGVGAVFLKKFSSAIADGDQILGVIASSRVYQNQNCTAITVPNAVSLSELFVDVVRQARLEPKNVSVVEAHGTGTPVGDPAEYEGIRRVFGGPIRSDILSLTSVKGLVGHSECASGVVSLVKTLLMIREGFIPPQASFNSINPSLNATPEDRIEISTRLKPWDADFRAALINNYGASGSNASMVVTQAPKLCSQNPSKLPSGKNFPFWFCGLDENSLRTYVAKLRRFLQREAPSAKDFCVSNLSFQVSRQSNRSLPQALIFNASSSAELIQRLAQFEKGDKSVVAIQHPSTRPVILCFGGQISTYIGLDQEIYDSVTILRSYLDQCNAMCLSLGLDSIYPDIFHRSPIKDIVKLQIMLFATQYACAKTWIDSGVEIAAVIGHSFGELTALCVSKAVSLKDAIKMVSGRARLIQDNWGTEKGSMVAVETDLADLEALLTRSKKAFGNREELSIACYNGPRNFTLAGSVKAVQFAEDVTKSDPTFSGMKLKKINVTNAFHSALVDNLVVDLEQLGQDLVFNEPNFRLERATEQKCTDKLDARFIASHMRNPVFFSHAVQRLTKEYPAAIWLEAGSNSTITTMASRSLGLSNSSYFQPVNITSNDSFQFLVDTTTKLWRQGLNISFWAHHPIQTSEYTPVILPPYQFEKSRHWMDLKSPQELYAPIGGPPQTPETPKGLTTFLGYQDNANRSARFQVNTTTDKFNRLMSGHIMAGTAAVCPGVFQADIVIDAMMSLRPDFQDWSFQPQLQGMEHYHPLVVDDSKLVWIDSVSSDVEGLVWNWKLIATETTGSNSTHHSSGTIAFRPANDPQLQADFERLERLAGRKRCVRLLESKDADDVLQGRNIYRAFAEVIDYKEVYRNVTKIVGRDNESAGHVVKTHNGETWLDTTLADCFCQVAGIFVNIMTDKADVSERGIFVASRIDRWIRSPRIASHASLPDTWEVFAIHHALSEKSYVSDIFAFDTRDGSLVEVVLGLTYQRVSMSPLRKVLSRLVPSGLQLSTVGAQPAPAKMPTASPLPASTLASIPKRNSNEDSKNMATKKATKSSGPDVARKTREILCNLSGLESHEVKDDSDLVELGIDSLMSMELVREVDSAFKCTLETAQLMDLTDFWSLVVCIRTTLGLDSLEVGDVAEAEDLSKEESEREPSTNGVFPLINGVDEMPNGVSSHPLTDTILSASMILDAFREAKEATDDFILNGQLGTYYNDVMPRSTELCVSHIVNAFEELGCPIRSAAPGQKLERVPYLPKHEQFMGLIYELLWKEARLIDINGSEITRTAVAPPTKSVETLLQELLRDEPVHAAEHKLTSLTGVKFADCLTGKEDGLQLIFGTPEGREIASDVYAKSPINLVWIQQAEYLIEQLVARLPKDGEPLRILEMGAGTGGTTSKMLPLLARLDVPVKYTMTDLSSSLIAAARKRFKQYPFVEFKVLNIESPPDPQLLHSQHIVLATNCVHATRNLVLSTTNIHRILRPDGFLLLLEMTEQVPWVDFIFGLLEGWWLFEDGRRHALAPATHWEKTLLSVGYAHVDWTEGNRPESNIQRLIIALASGPRYDRVPNSLSPPAQTALTDTTGRQAVIDAYIHEYTKDFRPPSRSSPPHKTAFAGQCVLVTGATGSLGSHIVACLAQIPDVQAVVCLNRLSTVEATVRQQKSLKVRGISLNSASMSKLKVLETDTGKPMLGLPADTYETLVNTVTHIVHNAWPMSLTRPIRAYESQFKVMKNLITLGREATAQRPAPFKFSFQFISSIGTVGCYPLWSGKALAPEESMTADSVLPVGYADAKLVCERMLDETLHRYPKHFRPMAVRIAQIAGSTSNGYWNPVEHLAFMIKSSQVLKILPDLNGSLSWCPVNDVAATLGDLLISDRTPYPIYHIENPCRQPWREMVNTLADVLDIPRDNIIPFAKWVDRVGRFPGSTNDNPAGQLVGFFDKHFIRMSCGGLILDTAKCREHSETLRRRGPVSAELVAKYISAWKNMGFLN